MAKRSLLSRCPSYNGKCKTLVVASEKIGLEVNADKTKYNFMSRVQNAGRSQSIMSANSFLKGWMCLDIWEKLKKLKLLFRDILRAR
jgi:hypothetical protein